MWRAVEKRSTRVWRHLLLASRQSASKRDKQIVDAKIYHQARALSSAGAQVASNRSEDQTRRLLGAIGAGLTGAVFLGYFVVNRTAESKSLHAEQQKEQEKLAAAKRLSERLATQLIEEAEPKRTNVDWKKTLERVVPAIVSLKLNRPKFFDTESPANSSATGFVVDSERGIILTNRHVVSPGPIDAEAVFQNHEEVRVHAIYRDPVHDFGFFRYDPSHVKHLNVPSLPLCPEKASVGTDIRVVGNDAAEKLAIASGTLARLDRDAPIYGLNTYNDFNTFYFQASSGTTGGSSGSPVLNHEGEVLALNAGGKLGTSAGFYLPLDRVKRAFELIRDGQKVTRGTIQTVFQYKPFDEVRRLGLSAQSEELVRSSFPLEAGMLTVAETVPKGPSHGKLEPGDVLIRVNDQLLTRFVPLESILDDSVGKTIKLEVERSGNKLVFDLEVQDLHAVTPSTFLEVGGAVINPLSYQHARNHALTPGTPYVADAGYSLQRAKIPRSSIIHSVNGVPTPNLQALRDFLVNCRDGERVVVKFSRLSDQADRVEVVHMDRKWFPLREYTRDDNNGTWECQVFGAPDDEQRDSVTPVQQPVGTTSVLPGKNDIEAKLSHSLVTVDFDRPFSVNSLSTSNYRGTGLVIDADKGLVVVDRNTVTDGLGDAMVTFASTIVVPAKVVFVHPVHNFAIVQYDPKLIGSTPIKSCEISKTPVKPSDRVWLVGLMSSVGRGGHSELVSRDTIVSGVKWVPLPLPNPPRYQEHNLEMVALQDVVRTDGGVVSSPEGQVQAFWASFSYQQQTGNAKVESQFSRGIPIDLVMESAEALMKGQAPELYDVGVDFELISLAKARELGLDQSLVDQLQAHSPEHRTILSVSRRWGGTNAAKVLKNGDILVAVDGEMVTSFREVERKCSHKPQVTLTIVRDGKKQDVQVKTLRMESTETNHIVFWQGLLLQTCPLSVSAQRGLSLQDGLYVSCRYTGSPAARSGPPPTSRIKEIDGLKVSSLDEFVRVVKQTAQKDAVRIKYIDLNGKTRMTTMKMDPKYWPTSELVYENDQWQRRQV